MVDAVYMLAIGGRMAKPVGLVQRSASTCVLFRIHHVNLVNCRNGSVIMIAP